jgi:hypothetical protein
MIDIPKRWRDEYRYSADLKPLGWVRTTPGSEPLEFAADGRVVVLKDAAGSPVEFSNVTYTAELSKNRTPVLKMVVVP